MTQHNRVVITDMKRAKEILIGRSLSEVLRIPAGRCAQPASDAFAIDNVAAADNAVGHAVEQWLKEGGYLLNPGAGPDIPGICVEIKTRKIQSNAPWTIGGVTIDTLIASDASKMPLLDKLCTHMHVMWCAEKEIITGVEILDLTEDILQQQLINTFKELQDVAYKLLLPKGAISPAFDVVPEVLQKLPKSINSNGVGYLELKTGRTYQFRIRPGTMEGVKHLINSKHSRKLIEERNG